MPSLAIINQVPPYGTSHAAESIDLAMIAGTFGQDVSLYFIGDGVFQLIKEQNPSNTGVKNLSKILKSLPFFDVEKLYVCEKSMKDRGLNIDDLCVDAAQLSVSSLSKHLASHSHTMVF
jgi:tRNA 2-thiouridine synthesizing protein C